jgi:hypothetical protein
MRATWLCLGLALLVPSCGDDNSGGGDDLTSGTHDQAVAGDGGARDQAMGGGDLAGADLSTTGDDLAMPTDQSVGMNDLSVSGDQAGASDLTAAADLSSPPTDATQPADLSAPPGDMSGTPPDLTVVSDLSGGGVACGNVQCPVGQKCCAMIGGGMTTTMCADSCPDGDFSGACDGPEDCSGDPCCIQVMNMTSNGSTCTMAANACFPQINLAGNGQTRACHANADCTSGAQGTQLNLCCSIAQGGATLHLCLNQIYANFLGGTCP